MGGERGRLLVPELAQERCRGCDGSSKGLPKSMCVVTARSRGAGRSWAARQLVPESPASPGIRTGKTASGSVPVVTCILPEAEHPARPGWGRPARSAGRQLELDAGIDEERLGPGRRNAQRSRLPGVAEVVHHQHPFASLGDDEGEDRPAAQERLESAPAEGG